MKTPTNFLIDFLEMKGWEITDVQTENLEWWADEIWKLRSRWSPEGVSAFLTLLVDPQHDGNRKKGQFVWGVGCSSEYPTSRTEAQQVGSISMGGTFRREIEVFIGKVESLRSGAINDIGL